MVTAILPSLTDDSTHLSNSASTSADAPEPSHDPLFNSPRPSTRKPSVLAGYVGFFTGCGALVALAFFLPLPAKFSDHAGVTPGQAIQYSFYVVAGVAACVAVFASWGLRGIRGEEGKGWRALFGKSVAFKHVTVSLQSRTPYLHLLRDSVRLAFYDSNIALGYLGGFVARASTVAISLFIPLYINTYFIRAGYCHGSPTDPSPDLKRECRTAYVLASILTGVAQLIALMCAPLFGYISSNHGTPGSLRRYNWPVIVAAASGVIGYSIFPSLDSPEFRNTEGRQGSPFIFVVMALVGISQIGAIVCSLGSLGKGILSADVSTTSSSWLRQRRQLGRIRMYDSEASDTDDQPLLGDDSSPYQDERGQENDYNDDDYDDDDAQAVVASAAASRVRLKGSIAGVYSWCGGAAILILTKAGGYLFDKVSTGAPFYMMAGFNAMLLVTTVVIDVVRRMADR